MTMLAICKKFKRNRNFNDITITVEGSTTSSRRRRRRKVVTNCYNLKLQTIFLFPFTYMLISKEQLKELPNKHQSLEELDAAATKIQKVYRSYRTRRNLADCAVVCEELWWKASEFANESESAISRWARARTMAAEVGIGLPKDDRAQKLALRHWLEAIDPRHRYGHNLNFYYDVWFWSQSSQPFFYWLDVGDGKGVDLEVCPRKDLQRQRIKYLGPEEREAYEVIVEGGRLVYRQSKKAVHTTEGDKWIFVLSSSKVLYVAQKKKGQFQHSSFLSGAATISSGRLVAHHGVLHAIWPYSGHYRPTAKNFKEFICFLEVHNVDLTNVKKYPVDDDVPELCKGATVEEGNNNNNVGGGSSESTSSGKMASEWSTGVGPRICCMIKYSIKLQVEALEQLNLSPRLTPNHENATTTFGTIKAPITFMRPSMKVHLSPGLVDMDTGLPTLTLLHHLGIFKSEPTHTIIHNQISTITQ